MDRWEVYLKDFAKEFNQIRDFRLQVLFLHLHIEYWINEIIKKYFKKSDKILKFTFANKLKVIEGLNLIPLEVISKI